MKDNWVEFQPTSATNRLTKQQYIDEHRMEMGDNNNLLLKLQQKQRFFVFCCHNSSHFAVSAVTDHAHLQKSVERTERNN